MTSKCSLGIRWSASLHRANMSSLTCSTANAPMLQPCLRVRSFFNSHAVVKGLSAAWSVLMYNIILKAAVTLMQVMLRLSQPQDHVC